MAKAKLPKKPKAPKISATVKAWENYDARYHAWQKRVTEIQAGIKKKAALIKKYKK